MAKLAPLSFEDRLRWYTAGEHWDPQVPYPLLDPQLLFSVDLIANMQAHPAYEGWVDFYYQEVVPRCVPMGEPPSLYLSRADLEEMLGGDSAAGKRLYSTIWRAIQPPTLGSGKDLHFEASFALTILMKQYIPDETLSPERQSDEEDEEEEEVELTDFKRMYELAREAPQRTRHQLGYANLEALPVIWINGQDYLLFGDILAMYEACNTKKGPPSRVRMEILYQLAEYCMDPFVDFSDPQLPPPVKNALSYHPESFDPARTLLELRGYFLENAPSEPDASEFARRGPHVRPMHLVEVVDVPDLTEESLTEISEQEKEEIKQEEFEEALPMDFDKEIECTDDPEILSWGNALARFFLSAFRQDQVLFCAQRLSREGEAAWWKLRALSAAAGHFRIRPPQMTVILVQRQTALAALCHDTPGALSMRMLTAAPLATLCPEDFSTEAALASHPSVALLRYRSPVDELQDLSEAGPSS